MSLTDQFASEMPADPLDFHTVIRQAIHAFELYQSHIRPTRNKIFTVLEEQSGLEKVEIEALRKVLGTLEGFYLERQVAMSTWMESGLIEDEFAQEMALALTKGGNMSHPVILAYILETCSELDQVVENMNEKSRMKLLAALQAAATK